VGKRATPWGLLSAARDYKDFAHSKRSPWARWFEPKTKTKPEGLPEGHEPRVPIRLGSEGGVSRDVRFANRPFGVKHFQTIHQFSVDAARRLVLLFGIGSKALPSWDSKTRWNNLWDGVAVRRTVGPSGHLISPHPSSREGHHSTARWNSSFLLSHLIPRRSHAAATSRVQRNSVPSTHMRCMITANRRAKATIAFFSPRCLAISIAQALSHDHFHPARVIHDADARLLDRNV
jgi:hypothetical protein